MPRAESLLVLLLLAVACVVLGVLRYLAIHRGTPRLPLWQRVVTSILPIVVILFVVWNRDLDRAIEIGYIIFFVIASIGALVLLLIQRRMRERR